MVAGRAERTGLSERQYGRIYRAHPTAHRRWSAPTFAFDVEYTGSGVPDDDDRIAA